MTWFHRSRSCRTKEHEEELGLRQQRQLPGCRVYWVAVKELK